jgi:YegS/Rv2252/BmrU family lipid kinase
MRLIVNPRAGRGVVERALPRVLEILGAEGLAHTVALTSGPSEATELARAAIHDGVRFIVAMGGDGTVHEVVNGMMADDGPSDPEAVLGVVPSGSGCDLARTFGIRQDPVEAARGLAGKTVWGKLDIGRVRYRTAEGSDARRWFVNIAEAGIGAAVVEAAAKMPRWLGGRAYRLAALKGILGFRPQEASLLMNGRKARGTRLDTPFEETTYGGTVTMIVVANCQFFGGGLRVAPRAIPSDGAFDIVVGEGTKMEALTALRKMPLGTHVPAPTMMEFLADRVELNGTEPMRIEADGELLGSTPATFDLVRAAIPLKV